MCKDLKTAIFYLTQGISPISALVYSALGCLRLLLRSASLNGSSRVLWARYNEINLALFTAPSAQCFSLFHFLINFLTKRFFMVSPVFSVSS